MPTKTKRDEHKWEKAKGIADDAGQKENFAYIMGIYKKMKPDYEFKTENGKPKTAGPKTTWTVSLFSDSGKILFEKEFQAQDYREANRQGLKFVRPHLDKHEDADDWVVEETTNKRASESNEAQELAIRFMLAEDAIEQDNKTAATYDGNLGMAEMFKFYKVADPKQTKTMDRLLDSNKTKAAWELLKQVTGVKLRDIPGLRLAKTNAKVVEVPNTFHAIDLQPPKAKRSEFPFEGYIDFQGLKIDVENVKGGTRSGTGPEGDWSTSMFAHYGEIRGTEGTDGDKLDVYVGDNHDSSIVVVIHQHNPWDGAYDEDKVVIGCESIEEAIGLYKKQYDRPGFFKEGEYTAMPIGAFWRWVSDKKHKGKKVTAEPKATVMWKKGYAEGKPGDIDTAKNLLASLLGLFRATQWNHLTSHWQSGYGTHLMFERMYGKVVEEIDTLAEKIVGSFGNHAVDAQNQAVIMGAFLARWDMADPIERGLAVERTVQVTLKLCREALDNLGQLSLGMDDFLASAASDHDTHIYLLQQRNADTKVARVLEPGDHLRGFAARNALHIHPEQIARIAGWWAITPEGGRVPPPVDKGGLQNAIPCVDGADDAMYLGDGPADIMGDAIKSITKMYEEAWGRKPYMAEMQGVWGFSGNPDVLRDMGDVMESKTASAAPLEMYVNTRKGYALIHGGGNIREITEEINRTMTRNVPNPQQVGKVRGAKKAFSFHWSNAQNKWDVISVRDFPWGIDGAEFIVFVGKDAKSPVDKPWTLSEMRYVAKGLMNHPGASFAVRGAFDRLASEVIGSLDR